ncbi:MAG: SOS response-associated peptidase family protein [Colwellia sp.]|nr:SOS response-associated peptidase family protein [Colwellia sp.]
MCGRLNVSDDPFVTKLLANLGIENPRETMRYGRMIGAANVISIVREKNRKRQLDDAQWWLLQEPTAQGFKPSKYTSFNTRYDKLNSPRSAGFKAYRESRCVIVAKGFGETEGKGANARYHDFYAEQGAIALGGLYRQWLHPKTQETLLSCSVITLPAHDKLMPFHTKASPLMLSQDDDTIDLWLDSSNHNTEIFTDLLKARIPHNLTVEEINKPSLFVPIGPRSSIPKD